MVKVFGGRDSKFETEKREKLMIGDYRESSNEDGEGEFHLRTLHLMLNQREKRNEKKRECQKIFDVNKDEIDSEEGDRGGGLPTG